MADPVGLGAVGVTTVAVKASGCSISVAMTMSTRQGRISFVIDCRVSCIRMRCLLRTCPEEVIGPNQTRRSNTIANPSRRNQG